ncbi:hypothetical protein LOK49_Contig354G00002 [Camellia lanceoleosa]|nr:hypothetical protein LOK49_Contig354G00002 [Camellia lanceoleosa]
MSPLSLSTLIRTHLSLSLSDKEDGGDGKKLRLSKDQSAVLEESLKLSTLNPMVEDANAVILTFGSYRLGVSIFMLAFVSLGYKIGGASRSVFFQDHSSKGWETTTIELVDAKTKEPKDTSEVDAALIATGRGPFTKGLGLENINVVTQRGFVLVDERMQVPHLYCIDDANEKMILAYAASAQGISVVEQVSGKDHVLNHLSIPAACFTHLEISNGWTHRASSEGES